MLSDLLNGAVWNTYFFSRFSFGNKKLIEIDTKMQKFATMFCLFCSQESIYINKHSTEKKQNMKTNRK